MYFYGEKMKIKRSKILTLTILIASLILTINSPKMVVFAGEVVPMHEHVWKLKSQYKDYDVYVNSQYHADYLYTLYKCDCSEEDENEGYYNYRSHSFMVTNDYHSGQKHYFDYECNACGFSKSSSYNCSGNPCITPFRVVN